MLTVFKILLCILITSQLKIPTLYAKTLEDYVKSLEYEYGEEEEEEEGWGTPGISSAEECSHPIPQVEHISNQINLNTRGILGINFQRNEANKNKRIEAQLCVHPSFKWADQFKDAKFLDGIYVNTYPTKTTILDIALPSPTYLFPAYGFNFKVDEDDLKEELAAPTFFVKLENILLSSYEIQTEEFRIKIDPIGLSHNPKDLRKNVNVYMALGWKHSDRGRWVKIQDCNKMTYIVGMAGSITKTLSNQTVANIDSTVQIKKTFQAINDLN